ncbi:MAG: hypothetical protein MAG794_00939 [Gammaproteobacteria bacterium]|nr:hypothetical protein [Gammaproteobacteria bacterium]
MGRVAYAEYARDRKGRYGIPMLLDRPDGGVLVQRDGFKTLGIVCAVQ